MNKVLRFYLILILTFAMPLLAVAKQGPPAPGLAPPVGLPIDSNILFLTVLTVIYAFYKLYIVKKIKNTPV